MSNWFRNSIVYQIFPDLFYKKGEDSTPKNYYGGNLQGIIEKLDYIKSWGFNVIYINPIFKSVSNHRYNVIDFYQVDPILGTIEDFKKLLDSAHSKGIRVILDIPFNHVSDKHPWFLDVLNNPSSKYRNYFIYDESGFNKWRGSDLVELNLSNEEVLNELITSENSVLKYWLSKGIDGIRLDCANDLGIEVSKIIVQVAHSINPDAVVMGEVFNYASQWSYVLDSLQSYYLTGLLFSLIREEISLHSFSESFSFVLREYNYNTLLNSLNILSSHDTARVKDVIEGDINIYNILLAFQFTFPGVPVVLYGEEVGLSADSVLGESSRKVMIWDEAKWDKKVMELYRKYIALRNLRREIREGKFTNITPLCDYKIFAFLRYTEKKEEFSIVLINPTDKTFEGRIFIPYSFFHDALKVQDLFSGEEALSEISSIKVKVKPYQVMVFVPNWKYIKGYSFYKRY
ncbi:MAG: glycoside hydrolase family 13 protein [Brevinematia bacterium]